MFLGLFTNTLNPTNPSGPAPSNLKKNVAQKSKSFPLLEKTNIETASQRIDRQAANATHLKAL